MRRSFRRTLAGISGTALVAAALPLLALSSANAAIDGSPTEIYPLQINITRAADTLTGQVTVADGETIQVEYYTTIQNMMRDGSLLPVSVQTTFGVAGFAPAVPAGLTANGAPETRWTLSAYGAQNCTDQTVQTPTVTVPAGDCHGRLIYNWRQQVTNNSGAEVVWDLPYETAQ